MLPNLNLLQRLPKWAYVPLSIFLIIGVAGTIYLTRHYALSNLAIIKIDEASRESRKLAIDVLIYMHVIALLLPPILFDTRLKWRRRQLLALGLAIWLFDFATFYQARVGIITSSQSHEQTDAQRIADKRVTLKKKRDSADGWRASAAKLTALDRIKAAREDTQKASDLDQEADKLADEISKMPAGTELTDASAWGEYAKYYAVAEALLVSAATLIALLSIGSMVRIMLERVAPDVERAAEGLQQTKNTRLKRGFGRMLRGALAALGVGAAAATATAGEAPVAPPSMQSQPVDDASIASARGVNDDTPAPVNDDTPSPSTPVNVDTLADAPAKARKARQPRVRDASSAVMDTGVGPNDGYRYRRALAAVKARQIRPSLDGLSAGVQASAPIARRYLAAMAAAGEIVPGPGGRGWVLASKGGAK